MVGPPGTVLESRAWANDHGEVLDGRLDVVFQDASPNGKAICESTTMTTSVGWAIRFTGVGIERLRVPYSPGKGSTTTSTIVAFAGPSA